jgi:hypothetical protein
LPDVPRSPDRCKHFVHRYFTNIGIADDCRINAHRLLKSKRAKNLMMKPAAVGSRVWEKPE